MDQAEQYIIENLKSQQCSLAKGLNHLHQSDRLRCSRFQVPAMMGEGFWERTRVNSSFEIMVCDVTFHERMMLRSREQGRCMNWGFCLADPMEWIVEQSAHSYELKVGEMSAYGSHSVSCIGDYLPGAHYHGLTIKLVPDFVDHLQQSAVSKDCSMFSTGSDPFPKNAVTPSMIRILHEIVRCDYKENIKEIYLEGKVLELTAMYLNDVIGKPSVSLALTRTDVDSLMKAKEILDTDLLSPPSLSQLSRLVCLNDFKLKRGFKQLFGLSVHAYVIDRRLEAAYHLLEEGSVTITMAAALSGFNKPSHFAEKFRQKYGASPSQYFRKLR